MSYRLEIRPDALSDIEEAAEWYEKQEPSLGIDFARTVLESIETLPINLLFTAYAIATETCAGF